MSIKAKSLANKTNLQIANLFSNNEPEDVFNLFLECKEMGERAEMAKDEQGMKMAFKYIEKIFAAIALLHLQNKHIADAIDDLLRNYMEDMKTRMVDDLVETIAAQSNVNPMFYKALAEGFIKSNNRDMEPAQILNIIENEAAFLVLENPEAHRFNIQDLPEIVQDHLAKIETIIKDVLDIETSAHVFALNVFVDEDDKVFVIRFSEDGSNDIERIIFAISIHDTCLMNEQHYVDVHQEEINQHLMISIARYMAD